MPPANTFQMLNEAAGLPISPGPVQIPVTRVHNTREVQKLTLSELISAAETRPKCPELLDELFRRDKEAQERFRADPDALKHIGSYPNEVVINLVNRFGWIPYHREKLRRFPTSTAQANEEKSSARTFADAAREWLAADKRFRSLDHEVRMALRSKQGQIEVDGYLWEMDPNTFEISRTPIQLGSEIQMPAAAGVKP